MPRTARVSWTALLSVLLSGSTACAGLAQLTGPASTKAHEPPSSWISGINFMIGDPVIHYPGVKYTTRVEFRGDGRNWLVSNRDLFRAPSGGVKTPWYRLRETEDSLVLKFTIEYPDSVRTYAEYRLSVKQNEFYTIAASVYKRDPNPAGGGQSDRNPVAFPLNPRTAAQPGDSLWISFYTTPRDCFTCPT